MVFLSALRVGDQVITSPRHIVSKLCSHWLPTFVFRSTSDSAAAEIFNDLNECYPWDWSAYRFIHRASVQRTISKIWHDSSPGEDGIPYSAYQAN
eukprot:8681863-Karenia_brevis.AAC.1